MAEKSQPRAGRESDDKDMVVCSYRVSTVKALIAARNQLNVPEKVVKDAL